MFDTSKAVDARRMAYEKLQGIYPSIFKNMSYEQALLKGQIELLNMSNRAARTTARETARINLEKAYQGLIDAERGVKDAKLYSVASDGHIMDTQMLKDAKAQLEIARALVKEAKEAGLVNLKGHRTVGGMRASIYNAMPKEGVEALVAFMKKFEEENA